MPVYLDFNASAPIDERVLERMIDVYRNHYGNADSRTHVFGTDAKEIVNRSRKTIADILRVDSTDAFFTSGATESNNMAILGLLEHAQKTGRNHFITTAIEHKSVLEAMKHTYVYDDNGRLIEYHDGGGEYSEFYTYNSNGQMIEAHLSHCFSLPSIFDKMYWG